MNYKYIVMLVLAFVALRVDALVVDNNKAGSLSDRVTDLNITTLTVTGSMNASDFYFIADSLQMLSEVDLSGVTIEACLTPDIHYWRQQFVAQELPMGAFGDMAVKSVVLPSELKSIGKAAFAGCTSLTEVVFPATLDSIADFAFAGCSALESVTLPASVRCVGNGAFMRCTALESFAVEPSSQLTTLDATALMDCPHLQTVVLGEAVRSLGERVLAGTGLQALDLTSYSHLKSIGDWAMVMTPVTIAKMPDGLNNVGEGVFLYDRDLSAISLGDFSTVSDYMLAGTNLNEIDLTSVSRLGDYALYNVSQIPTVELPSTTTWLGTRAMAGMVGITAMSCAAEEVPELGEDVWQGLRQRSIPLTVPEGSVDNYRRAEQWRNFWYDTGWLKGDVNGDGEVNVADINAIVGIILGKPADDATMRRADVNGDGEINIADINMVVSIILSPANSVTTPLSAVDRLHLDDTAIRPGEQVTLNLTLDHAEAYSAMQCDIILPVGLTLVSTTAVNAHQLEVSEVGAATTRTVTYSLKKSRFDAEGKPVLSITVLADESLASESRIVVSNIVLADEQDVSWRTADCSAQVTNSTGIEDLTADAARLWVEGRTLCIETRQEGTARVSAINGATRELQITAGVSRHEMEAGFYVIVVNNKSYKIVIK